MREGDRRRVAARSAGEARHGEAETDERAEDEEQPQVAVVAMPPRRSRATWSGSIASAAPMTRSDRPTRPSAVRARTSLARDRGEAGEHERDDDEDEQAHCGSAG